MTFLGAIAAVLAIVALLYSALWVAKGRFERKTTVFGFDLFHLLYSILIIAAAFAAALYFGAKP